MEGKTVITGGLMLAVGLLVGYAISPSGPDLSNLESALGDRIDAAADRGGEGVSAVTETVQALDARLEALSAKLGTLEERIGETADAGADAATSGLANLDLRLTETGEALRNALSEMAESQKASLAASGTRCDGDARSAGCRSGGRSTPGAVLRQDRHPGRWRDPGLCLAGR